MNCFLFSFDSALDPNCINWASILSASDDVLNFISQLCNSTRNSSHIILGASPTASVSLLNAARGYAAIINGKDNVTIDDVKAVAFDVLNHRIIVRDLEEGQDSKDYGISKIQNITTFILECINEILNDLKSF